VQPTGQALASAEGQPFLVLNGTPTQSAVSDLGLRVRPQPGAGGLRVAAGRSAKALRIVAPARSDWRLLRGEHDADRLLFERALVVDGDTEMGLMLKNTPDAIGPLWR